MFKDLGNCLLSLLSPQDCHVCSRIVENIDDGVACAECWSMTRIFDERSALCSKCGAHIDHKGSLNSFRCHKCDEHHYDRAFAIGIYEKALAATVINLKTVPHLPRTAIRALKTAFHRSDLAETELIIPVPLSRKRLIERGYNQAEVIGDAIGRFTGIEHDRFTLVRKSHTSIHRVAMDMKARDITVRNAFDVKRPKLVQGRNILLVDDVFTSGSTSSHCAKILKKNGAGKVNVFSLARASFN
ncbi:MAG: ComF family protein [Acidobacteriota bacterium]